jgi:eukaryotic-like serine/threonine-protein kinase
MLSRGPAVGSIQPASVFERGERVAGYTILSKLGEGGMGEVYLAEHRHIARKAAIKVLRPEQSRNEQIISRFFTEARAASLIQHPGIVEILDCDVHPSGRAFIVMEYLEGEGLEQLLARAGRLDEPGVIAGLLVEIADALAAAHAAGIVHRDLKPANVFLARDPRAGGAPRVKILDFGIAKLTADEGTTRTQTGSLMGTPLYMSPEQCRGAGRVDHRTDIYALGCIGFELASGRPPFVRDGAGELIVAHVSEAPPALSSLAPGVPAELERLVMRMLSKQAEDRPQTMTEVARLVRGWTTPATLAEARPLNATLKLPAPGPPGGDGLGPTQVLPGKQTTLSDTAGSISSVAVAPSPRRRLAVAAGVVAMVAGAGGLMLWPRSRPAGERTNSKARLATAPSPPSRASTPEPAPPPEPVVAATVSLAIASSPSGAEVRVRGEREARGVTPLTITTPRAPAGLELVLTLDGYLPRTVSVAGDRNDAVAVALEPAPTRPRPRPHPKRSPSVDPGNFRKLE